MMRNGSFTKYHLSAKKVAEILGSPWVFIAASLMVFTWIMAGPFVNYCDTWQLFIHTSTAVITFLMVFIIQNTQNRDSKNIQIKLDELLRANKLAHNCIIDLDDLSEEQIKDLEKKYKKLSETHAEELEPKKLPE